MKHAALLDKINETIEYRGNNGYKQRTLSGGQIGNPCENALWLGFRHCHNDNDNFDAVSLRRFDDGHKSEDTTAHRWIDAGIQLQTLDYETKRQIQVNSHGFWGKGLLDGIIHGGVPNRETEKFVWEAKCAASFPTKKQQEDESTCLREWNEVYYGQAQEYMGHTGIHQHLTSICKPGARDEIIIETPFDPEYFERLQNKRSRIIASDSPMDRISDKSTHYKCKMCSFTDVCHNEWIPHPTCRNCAFITFHTDGNKRASCSRHNQDMPSVESMEQFYPCHRFTPDLLPGDHIKYDKETGSITYRMEGGQEYVNGECEGEYDSRELNIANDGGVLYDHLFNDIKREFGGKVIKPSEFFGE